MQCKTVELREKLLQVANERVDEQAQTVQLRIHGALSDLHAADAQYHLDCYKAFTAKRNIAQATSAGTDDKSVLQAETSFGSVIRAIENNPKIIWNSVELYDIFSVDASEENSLKSCSSSEDSTRKKRSLLIRNLETHFGDSLLVMRINGCASILCLRDHVPEGLNIVPTNDDDNIALSQPFLEKFRQKKSLSTTILLIFLLKMQYKTLVKLY